MGNNMKCLPSVETYNVGTADTGEGNVDEMNGIKQPGKNKCRRQQRKYRLSHGRLPSGWSRE